MTTVDFLGSTKGKILRSLREGPRTAREIAADLGIQVSAARKHLGRLLDWGVVRAEFVKAPRGRPKKVFALTEEGSELFPRRYDAVLNGILGRLAKEAGEPFARRLLGGLATDLTGGGSRPVRKERIEPTVALLDELGFEVDVARRDGTTVMTSRNCPILKTARSHRELVCVGLHEELIRRATGARKVERRKWIVTGDPVCTHVIAK